jgi:hypothetical protein
MLGADLNEADVRLWPRRPGRHAIEALLPETLPSRHRQHSDRLLLRRRIHPSFTMWHKRATLALPRVGSGRPASGHAPRRAFGEVAGLLSSGNVGGEAGT